MYHSFIIDLFSLRELRPLALSTTQDSRCTKIYKNINCIILNIDFCAIKIIEEVRISKEKKGKKKKNYEVNLIQFSLNLSLKTQTLLFFFCYFFFFSCVDGTFIHFVLM